VRQGLPARLQVRAYLRNSKGGARHSDLCALRALIGCRSFSVDQVLKRLETGGGSMEGGRMQRLERSMAVLQHSSIPLFQHSTWKSPSS
jgi:hypothetical protein